MRFGTGKYSYQLVEGWGQLPDGWTWGWIPAIACDSQDRVYVYSRSEHPLIRFDHEGNYIDSWGEGILKDAHGIFIDGQDNVYCIERETHCIFKFNPQGELVMTLGTPGVRGAVDGAPFRMPTDLAIASTGELFITDGYENARVHKYTAEGTHLFSWGEWGRGPGQFELSHCVRIDKKDRLWVCDRTNRRIQIFDTDGNFITEWTGLRYPDTIYLDPNEDVVYIAELEQQVSIWAYDNDTLERTLITAWGGGQPSEKPGEFVACPHGIWVDSHGDLYLCEVQADARLHKYKRML